MYLSTRMGFGVEVRIHAPHEAILSISKEGCHVKKMVTEQRIVSKLRATMAKLPRFARPRREWRNCWT